MRTGFFNSTLMAGILLAGGIFDSSCFAARQVGTIVVDGNITDIEDSAQSVQSVASGFGAGNVDLFRMRVSNDASHLYLGISSKFSDASGTRGIWVFIDSKAGGQNTVNVAAGPGGAFGLNGTVLETGFNADYLLFAQNGNGSSLPSYYLDVIDLQSGTASYFGEFNVSTNSFTPSGNQPLGFETDVDNTETGLLPADAATASKGFEFKLPLSYVGATDSGAEIVQAMVGSGDGGNGYWSNQVLPASNSTGNLGNDPNFATNTGGEFAGDTTAFSGTQSRSMALPVSLSGYSVD